MSWNLGQLEDFIRYEHRLHNWIRILGAFGQAYLPPTPDHSHYNLSWSPEKLSFKTRAFYQGANYELRYRPGSAVVDLVINDGISQSMGGDAENWNDLILAIETELASRGFDISQFRSLIEVRYPDLLSLDEIMEGAKFVESINMIRNAAQTALKLLLNHSWQPDNEIRVWPHNFDTGIFIKHPNGYSQYAGYAPADEVSSSPYFYNSFYSGSEKIVPANPGPLRQGKWVTDKEWKGAILTLDNFSYLACLDTDATNFLKESTAAMSSLWE